MRAHPPPLAVLFDRDGTLVVDVPYNGDPDLVVAMPGAQEAVDLVRAAGLPIAVVSNQSGIGRGIVTAEQVEAVNERVDALLGGFDAWRICPHAPDAGCDCRKPGPGLVLQAAAALGVPPERTVVIGDSPSDVGAAHAAGAVGVLVPTVRTPPSPGLVTAADLVAAVRIALAGDAG